MQFGRLKLTRCKYGWMLHSGPYIGNCFELYGQYSESEVQVLRAFIRPGNTCLDVGANIGDLTVPMSQIAGPTGRVFAIESHPDTYHVLGANLALNGIENVRTFNRFVSNVDQDDTSGPWGQYAFTGERWKPTFMTIDSLGLDQCAFVKVDVDGKELAVLQSAERTIKVCRPIVYFENDDQGKSTDLLRYMLSLDYEIFFHPAPIFESDNFFGNPVNHWSPKNIISLMMLAIPREKSSSLNLSLRQVKHHTDWWAA
ncbi:MAG: hypothetical protein QOG73_3247 [Acetobacteraceae bacterium]|nr:hypothetical protein [Acetobacteraceae bacterium]